MGSIKMAKLDFLTIKNQALSYVLVPFLILLVFSFVTDTFITLGFSCAWVIALYGTHTFMIQESNCLERFYNTVPLKVNDVVMGRYLSTFGLYASTLIGGIVIFSIIALVKGFSPEPLDIFTGISLSLFIFSFMIGIQTPAFFKMGYMKGRMYSTLPFLIMFVLFLLPSLIPSLTYPVELLTAIYSYLIPLCLLASAALLFISYKASLVAYKSRRSSC